MLKMKKNSKPPSRALDITDCSVFIILSYKLMSNVFEEEMQVCFIQQKHNHVVNEALKPLDIKTQSNCLM